MVLDLDLANFLLKVSVELNFLLLRGNLFEFRVDQVQKICVFRQDLFESFFLLSIFSQHFCLLQEFLDNPCSFRLTLESFDLFEQAFSLLVKILLDSFYSLFVGIHLFHIERKSVFHRFQSRDFVLKDSDYHPQVSLA